MNNKNLIKFAAAITTPVSASSVPDSTKQKGDFFSQTEAYFNKANEQNNRVKAFNKQLGEDPEKTKRAEGNPFKQGTWQYNQYQSQAKTESGRQDQTKAAWKEYDAAKAKYDALKSQGNADPKALRRAQWEMNYAKDNAEVKQRAFKEANKVVKPSTLGKVIKPDPTKGRIYQARSEAVASPEYLAKEKEDYERRKGLYATRQKAIASLAGEALNAKSTLGETPNANFNNTFAGNAVSNYTNDTPVTASSFNNLWHPTAKNFAPTLPGQAQARTMQLKAPQLFSGLQQYAKSQGVDLNTLGNPTAMQKLKSINPKLHNELIGYLMSGNYINFPKQASVTNSNINLIKFAGWWEDTKRIAGKVINRASEGVGRGIANSQTAKDFAKNAPRQLGEAAAERATSKVGNFFKENGSWLAPLGGGLGGLLLMSMLGGFGGQNRGNMFGNLLGLGGGALGAYMLYKYLTRNKQDKNSTQQANNTQQANKPWKSGDTYVDQGLRKHKDPYAWFWGSKTPRYAPSNYMGSMNMNSIVQNPQGQYRYTQDNFTGNQIKEQQTINKWQNDERLKKLEQNKGGMTQAQYNERLNKIKAMNQQALSELK